MDITSTVEQQKQGIELCRNNAINLFRSAELLANSGIYSPPIPLLVLSSEEIIKSYALCMEFLLGDSAEVKQIIKESKSKSPRSYMLNHEEKHRLAKAVMSDLVKFPTWLKLIKPFLGKQLQDMFKLIELPAGRRAEIESLIKNIDSFNDRKNTGLYVDYRDEKWNTPLALTKSDYESMKSDVHLLFEIFIPKVDHILQIPNTDWNEIANLHMMNT